MRPLPPHALWLGHAGDGRDYRRLLDAGVEAIVQLAIDEPPLQPPRELICCRFPLVDGSDNPGRLLLMAIRTVAELIRMRVPTLVCCGHSLSRSPAVVAAALALAGHGTPDDCLRSVAEHHPSDITPGLWLDIRQVVQQPKTSEPRQP